MFTDDFSAAYQRAVKGGLNARLARLPVAHMLVAQKLGLNVWGSAPTFFGERMRVLSGETVSRGIIAFGYSEIALTALLLDTLKAGMTFVDVGAHLGYEAILGSRLVGPAGKVVTFEPQAKIAAQTAVNLRPFPQARLVQAAVGAAKGTLEIEDLPLAQTAFARSGVGGVSVPMTTLDAELRADERAVALIKVDVEGGEMAVLSGAVDILEKDRPLIVLEAEMPDQDQARARVKEFASFLEPRGYRPLLFDYDGELRFGRLGEMQVWHANVLFHPEGWTPG